MSIIVKERSFDERVVERLKTSGLHPIIARVFAARGVCSVDETNESLSQLTPPHLLKGVSQAAEMLSGAIERGEKIVILADYDCDGATGCSLGFEALSKLGAHVSYFIPDRIQMGYGLSPEAVEKIDKDYGPQWIVTVDNGISSVDGVRKAREKNIRVIITDHHLPGKILPEAEAIVNPNQLDCTFPSKYLSGVGVMFYVMLALRQHMREKKIISSETQPNFAHLLDFVAIGTIADMVPLDKNNRILVREGMKRIRNGIAHPGVLALFQVARKDYRNATTTDISFLIGPRINAAGRLMDMDVGISCLTAQSQEEAYTYAKKLDSLNRKRKSLEVEMRDQAILQVSSLSEAEGIVLYNKTWHPGLVGLIASRIKDLKKRPVVVFCYCGEGLIRGSGRSTDLINLKEVFDEIEKIFPGIMVQYGGHASAAGLTLLEKNLDLFSEAFEKIIIEERLKISHEKTVLTDGPLGPRDVSTELISAIEHTVWGKDFSEPLFCNHLTIDSVKIIQNKHLSFRIKNGASYLQAFQWNQNTLPDERGRAVYQLRSGQYGRRGPLLIINDWETCLS